MAGHSKTGKQLLIGLGLLTGAGAVVTAVWAFSAQASPTPPKGPEPVAPPVTTPPAAAPPAAAPAGPPAAAPASSPGTPAPPDPGAIVVPGAASIDDASILLVLDQIAPGADAAVMALRQALETQPDATRAIIRRYRATAANVASQIAAARAEGATWLVNAKAILDKIQEADAAFSVVGKIPFIGQIIQNFYALFRQFAVADAEAVAEGRGNDWGGWINVGIPNYFGWLGDLANPGQGDYWAFNLPVLSFMASIQANEWTNTQGQGFAATLQGLSALCLAYPFGIKVGRVDVGSTGRFAYKFNLVKPNDIGDAETAAQHVWSVEVWDPSDISLTGPKGFDPTQPRAWYARAQAEFLAKTASAN